MLNCNLGEMKNWISQQNDQIQTPSRLRSNIFTSLLTRGTRSKRFGSFQRKKRHLSRFVPIGGTSWPTLRSQPGRDRYIYSIMRSFYSVRLSKGRTRRTFSFSVSACRTTQLCFNFKRRVSNPPASILVTKCRAATKYAPACFNRSFFFPKTRVRHYSFLISSQSWISHFIFFFFFSLEGTRALPFSYFVTSYVTDQLLFSLFVEIRKSTREIIFLPFHRPF